MKNPPTTNPSDPATQAAGQEKLRIDKWLWAARFFKTRSLAADALKNGKILLAGERCKASRELHGGELLVIKQGLDTKTVRVVKISARRGPAPQAQQLYTETAESIENRERLKLAQQAQPGLREHGQGRPTKKERRQIIQFTDKGS